MSLVLHISDTHFGTEQPPVVAALQALVRERRPDLVILSGDVTQRATELQFEAARATLAGLGDAPLLVLPGNHDIPLYNLALRLWRPYARYLRAFGPQLEPVLHLDDMLVVGVNTTRPERHTNGEVSAAQIESVSRTLARARPGQLRIVVTHQPAAVLRASDEHDRLLNADEALHAWSNAGADLVLGGHIHLPYVVELSGQARPTPRPMWCVQAGTALSHRVRWGTANSVNLIHWHAVPLGRTRTCKVERCDYDAKTEAFLTASEQTLGLA
ncbi:metallophosphoesterase family protein [Ramlibacter rhizophilus]|uniref:Metallophosphoesterase n=1 Tax=Ramlibacter rhizophilus TaxID=1781167 RepID=A0A4Z0BC58_9BURK|nr:metallophosphoesterase [Ramlibacter rhizophilus]TFY96805.1 metallophosphoesterase [Ramlibacter rhizophilus]